MYAGAGTNADSDDEDDDGDDIEYCHGDHDVNNTNNHFEE